MTNVSPLLLLRFTQFTYDRAVWVFEVFEWQVNDTIDDHPAAAHLTEDG